MELAPDHCKAGMFGLYYLIRDAFVAVAAVGGAFLWLISPEVNFWWPSGLVSWVRLDTFCLAANRCEECSCRMN